MMLEFNEAAHVYKWDGNPVPNVTGIIAPLTKMWLSGKDLERARQEGKAIHKMVELECRDILDVTNIPEWMEGYLAAWLSFKAFTGFQLVASEWRGFEPNQRYAGTLDLDGVMTKFKHPGPCLIDIKRSLAGAPAVGVQLAGYQGLVQGHRLRYGLQLREDGEYRLKEYTDPQDRAVFLACLTLHRWRERNA